MKKYVIGALLIHSSLYAASGGILFLVEMNFGSIKSSEAALQGASLTKVHPQLFAKDPMSDDETSGDDDSSGWESDVSMQRMPYFSSDSDVEGELHSPLSSATSVRMATSPLFPCEENERDELDNVAVVALPPKPVVNGNLTIGQMQFKAACAIAQERILKEKPPVSVGNSSGMIGEKQFKAACAVAHERASQEKRNAVLAGLTPAHVTAPSTAMFTS